MITNKKKLIIIGGLALLYILGGGCDPITYAQEVPTIDEQSGEILAQSLNPFKETMLIFLGSLGAILTLRASYAKETLLPKVTLLYLSVSLSMMSLGSTLFNLLSPGSIINKLPGIQKWVCRGLALGLIGLNLYILYSACNDVLNYSTWGKFHDYDKKMEKKLP